METHTGSAHFAGASLRLRGKNLTETEHVKLGAYHTVELEPQRPFTLEKQAWDAIDIERIRQATDPALSADLAAVLIIVSILFCYGVLKVLHGQASGTSAGDVIYM